MRKILLLATLLPAFGCVAANDHSSSTADARQAALEKNTAGKGFGPQSPRNIDHLDGTNPIKFALTPTSSNMNLCNIHFHKGAEHKGGEFTKHAGDGKGYLYSGALSAKESKPTKAKVCTYKGKSLNAGDTIELHYVFSSAQVSPGPTLGACLSDSIGNPQLRVEAQVYVLVNDNNAADFTKLTAFDKVNGYYQPLNMPRTTGKGVEYTGSTTGPSYNEKGSPFQVSWSVKPKIQKVSIASVDKWCDDNVFNEDHAHGVRDLVEVPALLSENK